MTSPSPGQPGQAPDTPELPEYLVEHVRSALATDDRVHEQGLDVSVLGKTIVLRGAVTTSARRDAVGVVAREVAPSAEIVNEVEVLPNPEPDGAEEIDR